MISHTHSDWQRNWPLDQIFVLIAAVGVSWIQFVLFLRSFCAKDVKPYLFSAWTVLTLVSYPPRCIAHTTESQSPASFWILVSWECVPHDVHIGVIRIVSQLWHVGGNYNAISSVATHVGGLMQKEHISPACLIHLFWMILTLQEVPLYNVQRKLSFCNFANYQDYGKLW